MRKIERDVQANEAIIVPITLEDEDEIVRRALASFRDDKRFQFTSGQEKTIRRAAEMEEAAIRHEERK